VKAFALFLGLGLVLLIGSALAQEPEFPFTQAVTKWTGETEDSDNVASVTFLSPGSYVYRFRESLPTEDYRVQVSIFASVAVEIKILDANPAGFTLQTFEKSTGKPFPVRHLIFARPND